MDGQVSENPGFEIRKNVELPKRAGGRGPRKNKALYEALDKCDVGDGFFIPGNPAKIGSVIYTYNRNTGRKFETRKTTENGVEGALVARKL